MKTTRIISTHTVRVLNKVISRCFTSGVVQSQAYPGDIWAVAADFDTALHVMSWWDEKMNLIRCLSAIRSWRNFHPTFAIGSIFADTIRANTSSHKSECAHFARALLDALKRSRSCQNSNPEDGAHCLRSRIVMFILRSRFLEIFFVSVKFDSTWALKLADTANYLRG